MANPYTEDEIAASEAKSARIGGTISGAGALLNIKNVATSVAGPLGHLTGALPNTLLFDANPVHWFTAVKAAAQGVEPTLLGSTTLGRAAEIVGVWAPALVGIGGGIEVINDLRNHEMKKAGIATVKTAAMVATVFGEGALMAAGVIGGWSLAGLELGSLLLTRKSIITHIGEAAAGIFGTEKPASAANQVAPYGVPLSQQVVAPTVNYMTAPVQLPGNGVVQMMPATGQVAMAANLAPVVDLNQQALNSTARTTSTPPAATNWVDRTARSPMQPQSFVGALQGRAEAPVINGPG